MELSSLCNRIPIVVTDAAILKHDNLKGSILIIMAYALRGDIFKLFMPLQDYGNEMFIPLTWGNGQNFVFIRMMHCTYNLINMLMEYLTTYYRHNRNNLTHF